VSQQTLPPYEHIVFDPGSSDGSREVALSHSGVTLIAEPDNGQADAVGKGFQQASGDILGWLNSDDMYASNRVFETVLNRFKQPDAPDIVYGLGNYIDAGGEVLRSAYVNQSPETFPARLQREVGILQPALFIRKSSADLLGAPSTTLNFCMDYEYWIRAVKAGLRFAFVPEVLALARYYPDNKTWGQRGKSYHEICKMVKSHFGYVAVEWLQRYAEFRVKGHDGILNYASGAETSTAEISKEVQCLLNAFNNDQSVIQLFAQNTPLPAAKPTIAAMKQAGFSLKTVAEPVPLESKNLPNKVCYTVGTKRWAFLRQWKEEAVENSKQEFQRIREIRNNDTCVIVGNGPTLNASNFLALQKADVFISNYAFLHSELAKVATYYTVVNNLVAEQGAAEIALYRGPRKFFPYWLRYCIPEDNDTFFVNSVGFDKFSIDITENISWRSTVTFFNLQLAYGLGYRKILMIGFDHYYKQNPSAKEGDEIDCQQDDDNHFDKSYFKNKVWHAADVGNMEKMYLLAKVAYEADGREIVNCTVGGHLEVFRRGDLEQELLKSHGAHKINRVITKNPESKIPLGIDIKRYPRLLMIDSTPLGGTSATGQLKSTFLGDWPSDCLLQIWENHNSQPPLRALRSNETESASRSRPLTMDSLVKICQDFQPEAIYYRPVDYPVLAEAAKLLISKLGVPYSVHMMDDWPERLREQNSALHASMNAELRRLLKGAAVCWSICDKMSREYEARYGCRFEALANGVDTSDFENAATSKRSLAGKNEFVIRYAGALADDMTFQSVMDVARAVSSLRNQTPIRFEIHTMEWCKKKAEIETAFLEGISIHSAVSGPPYYRLLASSDALLIAYNFDPASIKYIRLSMANKMPECLASGAALLAYGPAEVATIDYLQRAGCASVVTAEDSELLKSQILRLASDQIYRQSLAQKAREFVIQHHSRESVQKRFLAGIQKTALSPALPRQLMGPYSRAKSVHYDETDAVAAYLAEKTHGVMLDVGAHQGYALNEFLNRGWKIWAFEPDHKNRAKLLERLAAHKNRDLVTLDTRCVSHTSQKNLPFFQSGESTGISGLSAFRDTHVEAQRVDTVSLSDYFADKEMPAVDFLKIDTEGHDLFVLQGFPWERNRPRVIECEFEDLKSKALGYTTKDMADFLVGKGYTVYVSEWHPILRYGQRHDWHRLMKYPCELACPEAWGNLLAFSAPPDEAKLVAAIKSVLKSAPTSAAPSGTATHKSTSPNPEVFPCFSPAGPNRWTFTKAKAGKQNLLIFKHPAKSPTANREILASFRVVCDAPVQIAVSLGRHDHKRPYEGTTIKQKLTPGQPWTGAIKHRFKENHADLKLQFEILDCPTAKCTLEIQDHRVQEANPPKPADPIMLAPNSFAQANKLYREGQYAKALGIYEALAAREPLGIYRENAKMTQRKIQLHNH
jgi:FkbM family methyltransferase